MTDLIMHRQHRRWNEYAYKLSTVSDVNTDLETLTRAILTEMGGFDVEASIANLKSEDGCEDYEHGGPVDGIDDIDRILVAVDKALGCRPTELAHRKGKWRAELETLSPLLIKALSDLAEAALNRTVYLDWSEAELAVARALYDQRKQATLGAAYGMRNIDPEDGPGLIARLRENNEGDVKGA
jgi:hypothetical protein